MVSYEEIQEQLNPDEDDMLKLSFVDKLVGKKRKFVKFKQHFEHLKRRSTQHQFTDEEIQEIQESATKIPKLNENDVKNEDSEKKDAIADADREIAELTQKINKEKFEKMLCLAEKDLDQIQDKNYKMLEGLYEDIKSRFKEALTVKRNDPRYYETTLYRGCDHGLDKKKFFCQVVPSFVQDMVNNREWYEENTNKFILNINYPCKLQTDCLKEMEKL